MEEEQLFRSIGQSFINSVEGNLFGKPCFKVDGKAFICFFRSCMVFKLTGEDHHEAISLEGAQLFDPSGKNRPMKEWVQLSYTHHKHWPTFAKKAFNYLQGIN